MKATELFQNAEVAALADAAGRGKVRAVREMAARGVNVNAVGRDGATPLLWALGHTSKKGMQALIEAGADVNYRSPDGDSAIELAAGAKDSEYLLMLLRAGADPNTLNHRGEPVIFTAILELNWDNMRHLLDHGADVNLAGPGRTIPPVVALAELSQPGRVAELIEERGADITADGYDGQLLAWQIQDVQFKAGTERAASREKVMRLLEQRGIVFPVERPGS